MAISDGPAATYSKFRRPYSKVINADDRNEMLYGIGVVNSYLIPYNNPQLLLDIPIIAGQCAR